MYTDIVSYQIVIALLKKFSIRHLVLSAGTRHTPFVRSVENDDYFTCYSVVDERSASFFAIGLIKELKQPVVICCTSGTALSNYLSGTSEAFYSELPLVVISSDRNNYYLNQQEEQCVPQHEALDAVSKKSVTLPIVKDNNDFWYCQRLVNEALLELNHHGQGPVHINVPIEKQLFDFNTKELPKVTKISRILPSDTALVTEKAKELARAKKIMVTYGQAQPLSDSEIKIVEEFADKFGAVIAVDHLSNLHCKGTVSDYNATRTSYAKLVSGFVPDILICVNGNAVERRGWLVNCSGKYKFWNVLESGKISDPFRCLTDVFECSTVEFFKLMLKNAPDTPADTSYFGAWKNLENSIALPDYAYSDKYTVKEFMSNIPKGSLLHLANSNSVRIPQQFTLDSSVTVQCNRGASGIDGSMSSFIGQAYAHNGLAFLLIGDLSFFYDMNALWNRYVPNNARIMLNNNGCGEIFYENSRQDTATVGKHIAADNATSAKEWVESRGITYLRATTKKEFDENLKVFLDTSIEQPMCFEVITDKFVNIADGKKLAEVNKEVTLKSSVKSALKRIWGDN